MRRVIEAVQCSILDTGAGVVVNASNPNAILGGGVSRALFDECGGSVLQEEMTEKLEEEFGGELGEEDCLVTSAGTSTKLKFILHVASVDYANVKAVEGRVQASTADRVAKGTEAAVRRAAELGEKHGPIAVAFPLLAAGSGGLTPGVALKAMVDGLRRFFREQPDAPITRVVFAVPELDKFEFVKKRLDELLVLR